MFECNPEISLILSLIDWKTLLPGNGDSLQLVPEQFQLSLMFQFPFVHNSDLV